MECPMGQRCRMIGLAAALAVAGCASEREPSNDKAAGGGQTPRALVEAMAAADLDGKVTLIGFGAAGNEHSDAAFEAMCALARTRAVGSLAYLRVEMLPRSQATEAYYRQRDLPFPVVYDEQVHLGHALDVRSVPTFILVGKFGRERYRGSLPAASLDAWAAALAAERVDPGPRVPRFGQRNGDGEALLASTCLASLAGQVRPLASYAGERGVVVVFIDTVCPAAAAAAADLRTVAAELARAGVTVVAVNLDDDEQAVRDHYGGGVLGVPVLFDDTCGTKLRWGIDAVPRVVYIDAAGRVAYRGTVAWDALGAAISAQGNVAFGGAE